MALRKAARKYKMKNIARRIILLRINRLETAIRRPRLPAPGYIVLSKPVTLLRLPLVVQSVLDWSLEPGRRSRKLGA